MFVRKIFITMFVSFQPGGGGHLNVKDTGLWHSNRKSTTHKSGEFLKSIPINPENFLKIIPINPEMP